MPPRMFEDLVPSRAVRPGGRARALPFSLAFHGVAVGALLVLPQLATDLPPVKAAPPPLIPTFQPVRVDVAPSPPTPPRPRDATPRARESGPRTEPVAQTGTAPAMPTDLSSLGQGEVTDDAPALCFSNCTGDGVGAVLPGVPDTDGHGQGGGDPGPVRAGRDVTPPAKLGGNAPVYPELAKKVRLEGDVVIECTIDSSGRVVNAVVVHSIPLLDVAAVDAVRSWRYRPTLLNGVPVPVLMTVTVRFRIR